MFNTSGQATEIPVVAYQLADHLDAALAAAEDLTASGREWVPATADGGATLAGQIAAERQVIERVRTFEALLIGRVLKARKRASVLAKSVGDLASITQLFVSATALLVDAIEELGDSTQADFDSADGYIPYLRNRGVIPVDSYALPEERRISLGNADFLVAGRLQLAPLTEMIVAFLDALEAHYDLYPDETIKTGHHKKESGELADILTTIRAQAAQDVARGNTPDQNTSTSRSASRSDAVSEADRPVPAHMQDDKVDGSAATSQASARKPSTLRQRLLYAQLPAE